MVQMIANNSRVVTRDSNYELLRIVCMLFIVMHHFITEALVPDLFRCDVDVWDWNRAAMIGLNYFCFIGVNVFVLISGYYGIRFKWRGLGNLYLTCAFYAFLAYVIHLYIDGASFGSSVIYHSVLVFSHNQWWFIGAYLMLYIFSPLINKGLEVMTKRKHIGLIAAFTFVSIYLGFGWNTGCNTTGHGVAQMVYMYVIGNYIRKYVNMEKLRTKRGWLVGVYIASISTMIAILLINTFVWHREAPYLRMWLYTNPLLIVGAIAFFMLFGTFRFKSRGVNWIAASVLAAYLLPEALYVSPKLYSFGRTLVGTNGVFANIALAFAWGGVILLLCVLIDKMRMGLMKLIEYGVKCKVKDENSKENKRVA